MENSEFQMETGEGFKTLDEAGRKRLAEAVQTKALERIQKAVNFSNKILAKLGFCVTVDVKFHLIKK